MFYDRGNFYDFTCILRELDTPGVLASVTQYPFDFSNAEKPYESYNGASFRAKRPEARAARRATARADGDCADPA